MIYCHWIDIAKGIGIILVILGHCIFPCHTIIDIFHMPLFFLLAGITFHNKQANEFVIGKINRIFVPYIFWAIISSALNFIPHNYDGNFNGPLWFLPVMFATLMTVYCVRKLKQPLQALLISAFILLSWLFINNPILTKSLPFSLNIVILSAVYMYIGCILQSFISYSISTKMKILNCCIFTVAFLLIFIWLSKHYTLAGVYVSMGLFESNFLIVFLCSIAGIFSTIAISQLIGESKTLEWFGRNSLALMCIHFPFSNSYNVFVSKLVVYQSVYGKIVLSIVEYILIFGISIVLTILCKKYLPQYSGYTNLIHNSNTSSPVADADVDGK